MGLTALKTEILKRLRLAVEAKPKRQILYCSEWLGYLPYSVYHWIEVDGQEISQTFPSGWSRADLEALEEKGLLKRMDAWQNPADEYEMKTAYEVSSV